MELVIGAVVAGILFAAALWAVLWRVVSRAVDNGLDWLIHTFGNREAAKRIEEKWRRIERGR